MSGAWETPRARPRRRTYLRRAVTCVALAGLMANLATPASAQAPERAPAGTRTAATAEPGVFGPGAASSPDVALDGWGDAAGYHVELGRESSSFAWHEVALLRPAGRDESSWTGYQCLSGDGRYAAVAILPASAVNQQAARDHGAFAYSVDLASGAVKPVASGVGLKYYSPGCGVDHRAVFTLDVGVTDQNTELLNVDLATGKVGSSAVVPGQVTSAVPVGATVVGVRGTRIVSVSGTGQERAVATAPGSVYELRPAADGGVSFLQTTLGAGTASAMHEHGGRLSTLGSGPLARLHLFQGQRGRSVLAGADTTDARAVSAAHVVQVKDQGLPHGATASSLDGHALAGSAANGRDNDPVVLATRTGRVLGDARPASTARASGATSTFVATSPAASAVRSQAASAVRSPVLGSAAVAAAQTPTCAVPRLDPAKQAMQPSAAQVDWAIQMAEQGLLTGSAYTRPANFANMGLAAYAPSSDFSRIALLHPASDSWDSVPRSVYEAIVAQESNFSQASWHSPAGVAGNPLIADYYGAGGDIKSINYAASDCGYGLGQVTTGMHVGDHNYSVNGQTKIAVDYEENVAAGLQILEGTWNQLYSAGIIANNGSPRYLENWYFAAWAYNSGIQPNAANGNTTGCTPSPTCTGPHGTWGLGWSNNPANLDYPPNRTPYLQQSYADAAHPSSWPYQERVLGWMASPLLRYGASAYATPTYHGGKTWVQPAPFTAICTLADNQCDPNSTNTTNPGAGHCMLTDYQCWWHRPVTWIADCATTCATSGYAVGTGSSEPANPSPHAPTCSLDTSKVPSNAIVVDDEPGRRNLQGCGLANWSNNGTFTYGYGTSAAGDPIGAIDTHQIGSGLGGRVLFTHTEDGTNPALINTGTWTPNLPSLQYYKIKLHLPAMAARATNVVYTINPGGGASPWRIRVNQAWNSEQWVTIGTFAMENSGNVVLTNKGSSTSTGGDNNSDRDVAFDAIAFVPQGGTPGKPIGGPPGIKDAPKGSNPAFIACGCARRTAGDPVDTSTGYFGQDFTDLTTPGRGLPLAFTRSYAEGIADPAGPNKALAADGPFGYGWTYSYNLTAVTDSTSGDVTVRQEDGSSVTFVDSGGVYAPSAPRYDASLAKDGETYVYTRRGKDIYTFDAPTGHLIAETDLAGLKATPQYRTTLSYDAAGHLATVTDPAGRSYTLTWSGGHIGAVADQTGRQVTYGYDSDGDLTDVYGVATVRTPSVQDNDHAQYGYASGTHVMISMRTPKNFGGPAAAVTAMAYDSVERVASQTDADGHTTTFTYGPDGGLTTGQTLITDPAGHKDLQTYQNGLLISETKGYGTADAGTATYTYDPVTLGVTTQQDADGNVQTFTYDDHGNRISASDASGNTTDYFYDDADNLVETIDANGVATVNGYDQDGHVPAGAAGVLDLTSTTMTLANNVVESTTGNFGPAPLRTVNYYYDDAAHPGDLTRTADPRGKITSSTFDAFGGKTTVVDPVGDTTVYGYDTGRSWLTSVVDGNGKKTTYDRDPHGRITRTTDPLNRSTSATYDADGNTVSSTDANSRTTAQDVDAVGQVVKSTLPDGTTQATDYNADGTIADTVDGLGAKTRFGYDGQGRGTTRTDPDNKVDAVHLDPAGRPVTRTDPAGQVTTFGYDAVGRVISTSYSDGATPNTTVGYDVLGQRVSMTDGTGTSSWTYDTFGELTSQQQASGAVVAYGYDAAGNQTSITYPGQSTAVVRTFDDAGRLKTVTDPSTNTTTFGYSKTDRILATSYPNGTTVTNGYDDRGGLTSTTAAKGGTTVLSATWNRDPVGQVSSETVGSASAQAAAYTGREQLQTLGTAAFAYDAANNPTTVGAATQTFDPAGRLCWSTTAAPPTGPSCGAAPAGSTSYTFDARGNRTVAGSTTYAYDQANRLTRVSGPNASATYTYNGDGLRASKTVGGVTTTFVWDGGSPANVLSDGATSYLYGPDGLPFEQIGASGANWFVHDELGSTIGLLNGAGELGATYSYTAYGVATAAGTLSTPLRYTGQYTDAESGLVYLRARYYDPGTALFLTLDPKVNQTRQPYIYTGDNPLNYSDITGESFWGSLGASLAVAGAVLAVGACVVLEPCGAAVAVAGGGILIVDGVALAGIALVGAAGGAAVGTMYSTGGLGRLEDMNWDPGDGSDTDGYNTSHNRETQQSEADSAWNEIRRRAKMMGKDLTAADRRTWHDEITGKGYGRSRIIQEGLDLFCNGG